MKPGAVAKVEQALGGIQEIAAWSPRIKLGAMFSNGGQSKTKRELVILLKPTVVKDDSVWTNDIAATRGRIESLSAQPEVKAENQ